MQVDRLSQFALLDITFDPKIEDALSDAGIYGFDGVRLLYWRRLRQVSQSFMLVHLL